MRVEDIVNELTAYTILDKSDLNIDFLSNIYNILVVYNSPITLYAKVRNRDVIFIKNDSNENMWKAFCHEFAHFYLHFGNQNKTKHLFNFKQEAEAEKFSLLLRMPERLIVTNELWTAELIVHYFKVTYIEAYKRLEMLINRSKSHRLVGIKSI
ncbi:ImmA/IrrE family metallo-endopeptidase [Mammaliicoccus sciuri]|uniref:ImmA/IrrE family metallo-endopeptidase n=1 Tax=Mammaliicoccus sciuri TaxID=1296 RepID=UPI002DBEC9A0|nr:ImmA/IrrE family metallo-endopeptidase [Mammaliicoccus sciuri]MEB5758330.1 ImmA/IrrE family metallo-endopeptidase [Mammaliicoccus sciuri]